MERGSPMSTNDQDSCCKRKSIGKRGKKEEKNGEKYIEFDENDRPTGVWMTDFASDMGRIVRNNIKLTYENWSLVPEGIKDTVWREAKKKWNIKDDEMRGKVLSIAAERLRGWRTYMTSYYVFKTKKQRRKVPINDPTTIYHGITKEDWAEFVRQRMDEKFQEKSRKAKESQKNNLHPHYMGRTGYVGKMPQWHREEVEAALSSNPDADFESTQESVANRLTNRGYTWIKAHTPSLKNPPLETQKLIEQIRYWKNMEEKGEFVPTRKEDVLVKATGKPEHSGRTRGVGGRVGIQNYFGKPNIRRRSLGNYYTENELMMFKEEVKKETMSQMNDMVNQKVLEIYKKLKINFPEEFEEPTHLDQSCCHSIEHNDHFHELQSPVPCRLAVYEVESETIVAEGTVWPWKEGTMVHNTPLSHQNVRVSIDNILDGKALLPVPWDENVRVAEVLGSFAQWPKSLVLLENNEDNSNEKVQKDAKLKVNKQSDNIVRLNKDEHKSMEKVNLNNNKAYGNNVQHENDKSYEKKGPLSEDELSELGEHCQRLERNICSATLDGYSLFSIKINKSVYIYEEDIEQLMLFEDIRELFRYYCLNITMLQVWGRLCTYTRAPLDMEDYVTKALKKQEARRYVMGAFRERAWKTYCFMAGRRNPYKKSDLQVKIIDCPQQPNNYECAYYVMNWMWDITVRHSISEDNLEKCVSGSVITLEEMHKVRELWSLYCKENI